MQNAVNAAQSGTYGSAVSHGGPALTWEKRKSAGFPGSTGANAFAQTRSFASLQPQSALAVEQIIRFDSERSTGMRPIVSYGSVKTGIGYELDLTPRNTLKWTVSGGAPYYKWGYEGGLRLEPGISYHVLGDFDGSTMHLYVNGRLDVSQKMKGPMNYYVGLRGTVGLAIGGVIDASTPAFDGAISDVAVYPRVLTAAELANHVAVFAAAPKVSAPPTPVPTGHPTAAPSVKPTSVPTPIAGSDKEMPKSVYSFAQSVGFVAHFSYHDSPYAKYPSAYAELIENGHIRNIRGAGDGNSELGLFNGMCASGVKHTLGFNVGDTPASIASQIKFYGAGCIDAVEPSNEYDAYALNALHPDPNWINTIKTEQRMLWNTMKSNPAWSKIVVLGPSLSSQSRYALLGNLESISDAGNQHDGTCDGSPLTTHYKNIVHDLALVKVSYPTKPVWTGETNYANNPSTSRCAVSKEVAGKYVPRMFLDRFNIGIPHTFYNELSDVPVEGPGWGTLGLTDPNAHPYPAYVAIQSLLGSLPQNEPEASALSPLSFATSGNTNGLAHTLLQSSDGTYYYVFWLEIDSWNVKTKADIHNAAQAFTLRLPSNFRSATLYAPNSQFGMNKSSLRVSGSVLLSATDGPSVLSFR